MSNQAVFSSVFRGFFFMRARQITNIFDVPETSQHALCVSRKAVPLVGAVAFEY